MFRLYSSLLQIIDAQPFSFRQRRLFRPLSYLVLVVPIHAATFSPTAFLPRTFARIVKLGKRNLIVLIEYFNASVHRSLFLSLFNKSDEEWKCPPAIFFLLENMSDTKSWTNFLNFLHDELLVSTSKSTQQHCNNGYIVKSSRIYSEDVHTAYN